MRAAFTPDGTQLVTVGEDNILRLWDLEEFPAEEDSRDIGINLQSYGRITFSPDGKYLAIGGAPSVKAWNWGELMESPNLDPLFMISGYPVDLNSLLYTPDGSRLITGTGNEISVWDASSGQGLFRAGLPFMRTGNAGYGE